MTPLPDPALLVQAAGDAIIVANPNGDIVVWNPAAERVFGFAADEAIGKSLDLIIPDRFRQRHWDAWHQMMSNGHTKYAQDVLKVPALHRDGHKLSIAFSVALLPPDGQNIEFIVAIARDETDRWNNEQQLRKRLADCEKQSTEIR